MRKAVYMIVGLVFTLAFASCVDEEEFSDDPRGNFEALWKIIDEHYCFFDYKNEAYGLNWNEVYAKYSKQVSDGMTDDWLFEVLGNMLGELRDGHVNLSSGYGSSQYREWFDAYPRNFSDSIQSNYLGKDYVITSGLTYQILENNIGYVYCSSFSDGIGDGNLDYMLKEMELCDGLIIDVRNNGGGNLTTAQKLAARFTNEKILVGYMSHKMGPGHNEFSIPEPVYIEPSNGVRWQKNCMKSMPMVTIMGDKTGGGSGLPFSSEIPNGWLIRFSAAPMYDAEMNQIEFGIEPDVRVDMSEADILRGKDTIIEEACVLLKKNQ